MKKQYRERVNFPKIFSYGLLAVLLWGIFLLPLTWAGERYPTSSTPAPQPDSSTHSVPERPPDATNTPRDIGNAPFDGIPKESKIEELEVGKIIKIGNKEYIVERTEKGEITLKEVEVTIKKRDIIDKLDRSISEGDGSSNIIPQLEGLDSKMQVAPLEFMQEVEKQPSSSRDTTLEPSQDAKDDILEDTIDYIKTLEGDEKRRMIEILRNAVGLSSLADEPLKDIIDYISTLEGGEKRRMIEMLRHTLGLPPLSDESNKVSPAMSDNKTVTPSFRPPRKTKKPKVPSVSSSKIESSPGLDKDEPLPKEWDIKKQSQRSVKQGIDKSHNHVWESELGEKREKMAKDEEEGTGEEARKVKEMEELKRATEEVEKPDWKRIKKIPGTTSADSSQKSPSVSSEDIQKRPSTELNTKSITERRDIEYDEMGRASSYTETSHREGAPTITKPLQAEWNTEEQLRRSIKQGLEGLDDPKSIEERDEEIRKGLDELRKEIDEHMEKMKAKQEMEEKLEKLKKMREEMKKLKSMQEVESSENTQSDALPKDSSPSRRKRK